METLKIVWQALSAEGKLEMAKRLETNKDYLSQVAHGHRNAGKHFKKAILADIETQESKAA